MKLKLLCVCGAALIGLPGCVMEPVEIGPSGPGYHHGHAPGYGQSHLPGYGNHPGSGAYDRRAADHWNRSGYNLGVTDFQNGRRPNVSYHLSQVPWQYRQGFTDAYNNAYRAQAARTRSTPYYQPAPTLIPRGLRRF